MIIDRLTVSCFGPFKGTNAIDFKPLQGETFLISGVTGSGKTSVIDAIMFALYGETSGSVRSPKTLRSQNAAPKAQSFAEVLFTASDGKQYTIHRDTSATKAEVWLRREEDKVILEKKVKDVNNLVAELVGFDSETFRRVTILPQGEFDKFLMQNSKERSVTLRKIFGTYVYEDFAEEVKKRFEECRSELESDDFRFKKVMQPFFTPEMSESEKSVESIEIFLEILNQREKETKKALDEVIPEIKKLDGDINRNTEEMTVAKRHNSDLDAMNKAKKRLDELKAKSEEINVKRSKYVLMEKAGEVMPVYENYCLSEKELKNAEKSKERNTANVLSAKKQRERAALNQESALSREDEHEELIKRKNTLTELLPKISMAAEAKISAEAAKKNVEKTRKTLIKSKKELEEAISSKEALSNEKEALILTSLKKNEYSYELEKIESRISSTAELNGILKKLTGLKSEFEAKETEKKQAEENLRKKEERHRIISTEYIRSSAARLAEELRLDPNMPCPVCGSLEHPLLAVYSGEIPTREETDMALAEKEDAQKLLNDKTKEYNSVNLKYLTLKSDAEKSFSALFGDTALEGTAGEYVKKEASKLKKRRVELTAKLKEAENAEKKLTETEKAIEKISSDMGKLTNEKEALTGALSLLEQDYAAKKAEYDEKEAQTRGFTKAAADKAIMQADESIKEITEAITLAAEEMTKAEKELSSALAAEKAAYELYEQRGERHEALKRELEAAVARQGFQDINEMLKYKSKKEERESISAEISEYEKSLTAAEADLRARKDKLPENAEYKDIKLFEDKNDRLTSERSEKRKTESTSLKELSDITSAREASLEISVNTKKLAEKLGRLKNLNNVVNGIGRDAKKITFEAFIQAGMFRRVLSFANIRLEEMSGGRYRFALKEESSDNRSKQGLDIDIIDFNTGGKRRDVSTLSGGERFISSFALASGLSDFTLGEGSNRKSDMLFIDEGFSTLDGETCSTALEVIGNLKKQNRMVGVITHISEIQEYFSGREIHIRKTNGGSYIEQKYVGGSAGEKILTGG